MAMKNYFDTNTATTLEERRILELHNSLNRELNTDMSFTVFVLDYISINPNTTIARALNTKEAMAVLANHLAPGVWQ